MYIISSQRAASTPGRLHSCCNATSECRKIIVIRGGRLTHHSWRTVAERRYVCAHATDFASPTQPDAPKPPSPTPGALSQEPTSYEWSFQPEPSSITLTGSESLPQLLAALASAAKEDKLLSQAATRGLETAMPPSKLAALPRGDLVALLTAAAAAGVTTTAAWHAAATAAASTHISAAAHAVTHGTGEGAGAARAVAQLLWGMSELGSEAHTSVNTSSSTSSSSTASDTPLLEAAAQAVLVGAQEGDMLASDLSAALCALGTLSYQAPESWLKDVAKEVEFQVVEFLADFGPTDLARLMSGLADLGVRRHLSDTFSPALMKAVYSKVRTIGDKAAVDFALAKLDADEKSMHYDPRWTHEELRWLPRRERDKRRIMQEGFYRTQWGGWAPGGRNN